MAESNITKRALAQAMKELIEEIPFEKINVGQICERCNMNRKSFYYHFRDKYDLVNWIFDTEFIAVASQKDFRTGWEFFSELCGYLYQNRSFYLRALKIKGQNSFSDLFREMMEPVVAEHLYGMLIEEKQVAFFVEFLTDAVVCAIERWIQKAHCVEPEVFLVQLKECVQQVAVKVYREMDDTAQ